jgi:hypothetical protein
VSDGKQFYTFLLFVICAHNVCMKRDARMGLRVTAEMASKFEVHAARLNQSASNLLVMLMESLVAAMEKDGLVVMPLQLKTPADCAPSAPAIHMEHNGVGHQKAVRIKAKR